MEEKSGSAGNHPGRVREKDNTELGDREGGEFEGHDR